MIFKDFVDPAQIVIYLLCIHKGVVYGHGAAVVTYNHVPRACTCPGKYQEPSGGVRGLPEVPVSIFKKVVQKVLFFSKNMDLELLGARAW